MNIDLTGKKCAHCDTDLTLAPEAINVMMDLEDYERGEQITYPSQLACSENCANIISRTKILEVSKGFEIESD